ncbi:MAG: hypothetical protein HY231_27120 [Acidobacteria bacterium]|nr:hypothetical protein [Acidobacteriota bacterium]
MAHEGMVHALHEAHRVLKADGLLLDLRPALQHRRVSLVAGKQWQPVGVMREKFIDDRAANRAVARVLRAGLFNCEAVREFDLDRVMDTTADFQAWLDDFIARGKAPSHEWLIKRLERLQRPRRPKLKIVVRGAIMMKVLRKPSGNH